MNSDSRSTGKNDFLTTPLFSKVTVLLGDPSLPDRTKVGHKFSREDLESVEIMKKALAELSGYHFTYLDNHLTLIDSLKKNPPEFVLNFCDTGYKNEAARELQIPAYLDMLEIPYSGSGPISLGLCYDKALVRSLAASIGIPVPVEFFLDISAPDVPDLFPALIKPNSGDGSVGITQDSVVENREQAVACLRRLRKEWPGRDALMQEFLSGTEYGVGLIGNPGAGFTVLPILEVDYSELDAGLPRILSYESKTVPDSPYWTKIKFREAELDDLTRSRIGDYASRLFERLGLRDYGRFDFRADRDGMIKLIEVNPNPAWCWDGKLNFMAGFADYSYSDLLRMILEAAQRRAAGHSS